MEMVLPIGEIQEKSLSKLRYQEVAERLQALVASGQLQPGDKIPPERTLAETFRVSRNCVREAVRTLAEKGVLESRQGDGTYVCAGDAAQLAADFAEAFGTQRGRLRDIMELRRVVEPGIAALAAVRATRDDVNTLKVLVFDQQRLAAQNEDDAHLDAEFHLTLARITGNKPLISMLTALNDTLSESRSDYLRTSRRKSCSTAFHLRIIDALEARDAHAARHTMDEHLQTIEADLFGPE